MVLRVKKATALAVAFFSPARTRLIEFLGGLICYVNQILIKSQALTIVEIKILLIIWITQSNSMQLLLDWGL